MAGQRTSINAKAAARKVAEKVANGEMVIMGKILKEVGYSDSVSKKPTEVTKGKAYKEELLSYTQRLETHRLKIMEAMEKKDLNQEQYRTLSDAAVKVTHDIQLLSGGKTENLGIENDRQMLRAIVAEIQSVDDVKRIAAVEITPYDGEGST